MVLCGKPVPPELGGTGTCAFEEHGETPCSWSAATSSSTTTAASTSTSSADVGHGQVDEDLDAGDELDIDPAQAAQIMAIEVACPHCKAHLTVGQLLEQLAKDPEA